MQTNTMIQVTIAIPTTDGHSEVTTFEYDEDEFSDPSIDDDFLVLIAGDTKGKGRAYVDILGYVFDKGEYFAAESSHFKSRSSSMYQTITGDLSRYLFAEKFERAKSDDDDLRLARFSK